MSPTFQVPVARLCSLSRALKARCTSARMAVQRCALQQYAVDDLLRAVSSPMPEVLADQHGRGVAAWDLDHEVMRVGGRWDAKAQGAVGVSGALVCTDLAGRWLGSQRRRLAWLAAG